MSASLLDVVHEDPLFAVIDKPAGLLAVPGRGPERQDCVVNRFKWLYPECPDQPAVHRLDMDTSGLMLLARTREAHRILSQGFARRRVEKIYIALLEGIVGGEEGRIELAFRLDPENRPRQVYDPLQGRTGITLWRRLAVEAGQTRVEFVPLTGRTHQLRLHAAHELGLGCAIVGDRLYGIRAAGERMLLHAHVLEFDHPEKKERVRCVAPVPF